MAILKLQRKLAQSQDFPKDCMGCESGIEVGMASHKFRWSPHKKVVFTVVILLYLSFIVTAVFKLKASILLLVMFAIVSVAAALLLKKQIVLLRLCRDCRKKSYNVTYYLSLIFGVVLLFAILTSITGPGQVNKEIFPYLMMAYVGLSVFYLFSDMDHMLIKCNSIDKKYIELDLPNDKYPQIYEDYMVNREKSNKFYCRKCDHLNAEKSRFCQNCGSLLEGDS